MKWTTQLISWLSTLIVARLLTPTDYGLMGMAAVYVGLVELVNEFGLTAAIVQRRDLSEGQIARLGGVSVLLGVGLFGLSALLAGPLAAFFGEPAVRWIIVVLSTKFVTSSMQVLPRALLTRELEFRKLAWIEGVQALSMTAVTLSLAFLGFRYWSLVLGSVLGGFVASGLAVAWRGHRVAWPRDFSTIAREVEFGWHMVVSRVGWYAYSNADFAVVGRVLGKAALGAYTLGWNLASIPVERVTALIGRVTPAIFSAIQHDARALERYLCRLTEILALVTFPASVGLALVADEFVLVVLGEAWRPAIAPLRLLALSAGIRSLTPLTDTLLVATGHTKENMRFKLVAVAVMPPLFYLGSRWGTAGVALAWIFGYPLLVTPFLVRTALRVIDVPMSTYLRSLVPALNATLVMTASVMVTRFFVNRAWPHATQLAVEVAAGVVAYVVTIYGLHSERIRAYRAVLAEVRG